MDGLYLKQAGTVKEGEAVFFRRDKWRLADQKGLSMRQCFAPSSLAPGVLATHQQHISNTLATH